MKKGSGNKDTSSEKQAVLKPASAGQLYRDRLNNIRQTGPAGAPGNSAVANTHNHLRNTSPGSTARKAKKGFRPG